MIGKSETASSVARMEWERPVALVVIGLAFVGMAAQLVSLGQGWAVAQTELANDYRIYTDAARSWLAGDGFYHPYQLEGPYLALPPAVLYPPPALILFVPFVFLPAAAWWVLPIGITAWAVWSHHPRPLAWAGIAVCLWFPTTLALVWWGNPGMWIVAFLAIGTRYGWPAVFVALKPSLAPFALVGIWSRSWWFAAAALAVVSLALLPMWPAYFTALRNIMDGGSGLNYSISSLPTMAIPLIAWLGRTTGRTERGSAIT